jgi:hypothetical protein
MQDNEIIRVELQVFPKPSTGLFFQCTQFHLLELTPDEPLQGISLPLKNKQYEIVHHMQPPQGHISDIFSLQARES